MTSKECLLSSKKTVHLSIFAFGVVPRPLPVDCVFRRSVSLSLSISHHYHSLHCQTLCQTLSSSGYKWRGITNHDASSSSSTECGSSLRCVPAIYQTLNVFSWLSSVRRYSVKFLFNYSKLINAITTFRLFLEAIRCRRTRDSILNFRLRFPA